MKKIISKLSYIKFTIYQVSSVERGHLIDKITHQLNALNYNINSSTLDKIMFSGHENKLKIVSVKKYSTKIQTGVFEFHDTEQGTVIKLTYFVTILSELIMLTLLFILAMLTDYSVLIIAIILFFRISIKTNKLKQVSKNLMFDVLK